MPSIGPMELVILLVLVLVVLGPNRLPEAGRALGRGMREFKDSVTGGSDRAERLPEPEPEAPTRDGERSAGSAA